MTKTRKLILDFDNTLANSSKSFLKNYHVLNRDLPVIPPQDFTLKWNFEDVLPNIDKRLIKAIFDSKLFFDKLEIFDGVKEILEELSKHTEIYICSIGSAINCKFKMDFIADNFPYCKFIPIVQNCTEVTMDKSMINMEGCVFIDDHKDNISSSNADVKIIYKHLGRDYEWSKCNDSSVLESHYWDEKMKEMLLKAINYIDM